MNVNTAGRDTPRKAGIREWLGLAVLALPTLLLSIDVTVLNLAQPSLAADLDASSSEALWFIDVYGFIVAGFLVTMGNLGDRIGRRRLMMIGALGFAAASVLAAYSSTPEMLIFARALLGFFGATLMPATLALISNMFTDPRQRAQAIAVWAGCFASGVAIGPVVGGVLLEWFWWGSVFLIAVPVMLLLLVAAPLLLPEYRDPNPRRLDVLSVLFSLVAVIPVIWGIKRLAEDGVSWQPMAAVVVGFVFGALFVFRQRRLADPLLDIRLFSDRSFSAALVVLLIGVGVSGGAYLYLSQHLQLVEGKEPMYAGLWLLPSAVALMITAGSSPPLTKWVRPGYLVGAGLLMSALGYIPLMTLHPDSGMVPVVVAMSVIFGGLGPVFALGTDLVVGAAPPERAGSAAAMSETALELGLALGVSILGSVGASVFRGALVGSDPVSALPTGAAHDASETLAGALAVAGQSPPEIAQPLSNLAFDAFTDGFNVASIVCGVVVAVVAVASFRFLRDVRPAEAEGSSFEGVVDSAEQEPLHSERSADSSEEPAAVRNT
ncbi:MFS transporter [Streptomyces oceani]|uniref:MFS transporter n=1 Tax=Streptomyces oceani TaxID=1075402 RepID=A0A1E7KFU9_9ACTN|nr:MFS transporter [Streptomyces oceani]OEV02812.1 MFS transporter [Streptomyces oceani]